MEIGIKTQVPAAGWYKIGYVDILPIVEYWIACMDTYNGGYLGMIQINTAGNIFVRPNNVLPVDHTVSAEVAFKATAQA